MGWLLEECQAEITAGGVLLGKDPVTHIKSSPSGGGCTLPARTLSTCFLTRARGPDSGGDGTEPIRDTLQRGGGFLSEPEQ